MDELTHAFDRLTRAVGELERVCIQKENELTSHQQELFAARAAASACESRPQFPMDQIAGVLDAAIRNIQTVLATKEAA